MSTDPIQFDLIQSTASLDDFPLYLSVCTATDPMQSDPIQFKLAIYFGPSTVRQPTRYNWTQSNLQLDLIQFTVAVVVDI